MPPDLINKALGIIQAIPGGISNIINPATQPPSSSPKIIGDPSQMKVTYGHLTPTTIPSNTSGNVVPASVTPLESPQRIIGLNPKNIDWLETNVLPITRKAGLPDPLVAAQWAIEGRKKDTSMFNLMFNGEVHKYQNIENNVNDYVRTVTNILKDKGYDIDKMSDPQQILTALQTGNKRYEGHSEDPMDYVRLSTNTPEYKYYLNQGGINNAFSI